MINYPCQTKSWSHPKRLRTPKDFAASFGGARGESTPGPLEKKRCGSYEADDDVLQGGEGLCILIFGDS